jgi:hypothetical protein
LSKAQQTPAESRLFVNAKTLMNNRLSAGVQFELLE